MPRPRSPSSANWPLRPQLWTGTDEQNRRIEKRYWKNFRPTDKGEGEDEQSQLAGTDPSGTIAVTKRPGRKVCYNATIALARRGSDKTRVDLLEEMLNEDQLREVFRLRNQNGQEQPDEAAVIGGCPQHACKASAEMQKHNTKLVTASLREAVKMLSSNKNPAIAKEAKQTQLALDSSN